MRQRIQDISHPCGWNPQSPSSSRMEQRQPPVERTPSMPRLTSVKGREGEEEEDDDKSSGVAPAQQPEEVEGVQLLQSVEKQPEEKEHTHCHFHRSAQMLLDFQKPIDHDDNTITAPEGMANADSYKAEDCAAMLHVLMGRGRSGLKKVPTTVRDIYQWLSFITDVSIEHRLDDTLQEMTLAQPHDVVVTLLRCAPSCDRAAVTMWRVIVSSSRTAEKVLPELLCVLEDWPVHRTSTSDKDDSDVFSLAATRALWEIIHLPQCPEVLIMYFPRVFVALLFQAFSSTEQMPVEVKAFWRRCQHKHCLPTNPKRFALLTMKTLLCHLDYEDVVSEVERECGWDTLLNTDTHHNTMGLLARAMFRISPSLCYRIARYLFRLLRREKARWEVSAMAFLVELLPCLNIKAWRKRILQLVPIYLRRQCRVMRLLVLRCLMVLCKRSSTDDSHVQVLSIRLFQVVMELVEEEGKRPLKDCVHQSLLPLFYHMYDENQFVAEASWEALLQATKFLKKENLEELLKTEELWRFGECLLEEETDRADGYLRQCVMYLQSPQKSIQQAAVRLTALQSTTNNCRSSISNLATQTLDFLRTAERNPYSRFRLLRNQLRDAWRKASLSLGKWLAFSLGKCLVTLVEVPAKLIPAAHRTI